MRQTECDQQDCPICNEEFNETDSTTTPCKHIFHEQCLTKWIKISNTCPMCRKNLEESSLDSLTNRIMVMTQELEELDAEIQRRKTTSGCILNRLKQYTMTVLTDWQMKIF